METQQQEKATDRISLTPKQFGDQIDRRRTAVYKLLKSERAPKHARINGRVFILESGLEYLQRLERTARTGNSEPA